ncbi:uncharacterized protein LOC142620585 [Castanea sativa]|uniref:uncharacterized protein LOC142620585 n=1 Tax=Castanea sativa TaxID=21020 RepID=UPI003F64CD53
MATLEQFRDESVASQRENPFVSLEQRRGRNHTPSVVVESYHTKRTERSHSRSGSQFSHDHETRKLQREIDHLRRKLRRRERDRRSPSPPSSDGSRGIRDHSYRHRSRTPSNESFSASSRQDKLEKGKYKHGQGSPHQSMGNDAMNSVADFTESVAEEENGKAGVMMVSASGIATWEVYTDGAANRKGLGVGIMLIMPEKLVMEKSLHLGFVATNNEAEYKALLAGMAMVDQLRGEVVELYSRLVVGQVNGEFEARDERMQGYLTKVRQAQVHFESFTLKQILRGQNSHIDSLVILAMSLGSNLPRVVIVEDMASSSLVKKPLVGVHNIQVGLSWIDPLVIFLKQELLTEDKGEAEKIRRKAPRYWLSEGQKLYKRSYSGPYLLCVHLEAMKPLLEELHEGICGSHTSGRSLAHRALTQGPRPFAQWGLDIVRPFPRAIGNGRWLLVRTDYFTKWVEAETLANIWDVDAKRFILRNIITRFGVPHTLISDNGLQFDSKAFRKYCGELRIRNKYSTPAYPQGNGQAETTNNVILSGLEKILDDAKGKWVDKLPHMLWTYRTMPRRLTGETSFSMTYGKKAVNPLKLGFPTIRTNQFSIDKNNYLLLDSLDVVEEMREVAIVKMAHYQQRFK